MTFDIKDLTDTIHAHGPVARVVVADIKGSSPREVGAAMLIWETGQSGTIGGGALEYDAARTARLGLRGDGRSALTHHALGPDLGQCCGGHVSLITEYYDITQLSELPTEVFVRPVAVDNRKMPLDVSRILSQARAQGQMPAPALLNGWMIEPISQPKRSVWVWGAGHVGRAVTAVLAPLPDVDVTWVDTAADRFPDAIPEGVTTIPQTHPADVLHYAPPHAEHYVLTYSHALDLELCHGVLTRGFAYAGLIGSATKWARFRKRLADLGHPPAQIARITCPIGDPTLGKHPQQIAIGVAQDFLERGASHSTREEQRA